MSRELSVGVSINARPQKVYAAIAESAHLSTWFAEQAEVSLDKGRYDFWGRYTPETPNRDTGKHAVTHHEPEASVAYAWHLRGGDTRVTMRIRPDGDLQRVSVKHANLPTIMPGQSSMQDFWGLSLENLREYVERGVVGRRFDYTTRVKGDVSLAVEIDAPAERVFEALTRPEDLNRYIASNAKVDLRVGGEFGFGWKLGGPKKILDLAPNKSLSYDWEYGGEEETIVTWSLDDSAGTTRLTLVHNGFAPDRNAEDYYVGWQKYLNRIRWMIEKGKAWNPPTSEGADYDA
jgi:uncharacterized protein YndB with AHSA1/START domain